MGNKTSFTSETGRAAGKKQLLPEVQAKKQKTQKINKLIKGELYDTIRTLLLANGGNTEDPYYKRFLEKYIKMGLEKPTSLAGERVANILLKENAIEALDELTDKALAKDIDFYQFRLQKRLFKRQKDLQNLDNSLAEERVNNDNLRAALIQEREYYDCEEQKFSELSCISCNLEKTFGIL